MPLGTIFVANDLTAKDIAELAPRKTPHRVAPNLYLIRRTAEAPGAWVFIYASPLTGKRTEMGLGPARDVSIKQAKTEALEHRLALLKGRCPLTERRAAEAARKQGACPGRAPAHTFKAVAKLCITSMQAGWKNPKQAAQWESSLKAYAFPVMGDLPVSKIEVGEVMDVLEPIWRTKAETASRVRSRIENVLDYAKARGWRSGENPARWRGHLDALLPARSKVAKVKHHAAVPWRELPALYQRLAGHDDISALALRYAILTGLRTGEVLGTPAKGEIDTAAMVHVIPEARMKTSCQHRVPSAPKPSPPPCWRRPRRSAPAPGCLAAPSPVGRSPTWRCWRRSVAWPQAPQPTVAEAASATGRPRTASPAS